jgi:hypothetical protein
MMSNYKTPVVPISWGELIDKITILEIKKSKIESIDSINNIQKELKELSNIAEIDKLPEKIVSLKRDLNDINLKLWVVEDEIREKDFKNQFDAVFIELAKSVYRLNDVRAQIKKSINLSLQSELIEEKSYKNFNS